MATGLDSSWRRERGVAEEARTRGWMTAGQRDFTRRYRPRQDAARVTARAGPGGTGAWAPATLISLCSERFHHEGHEGRSCFLFFFVSFVFFVLSW